MCSYHLHCNFLIHPSSLCPLTNIYSTHNLPVVVACTYAYVKYFFHHIHLLNIEVGVHTLMCVPRLSQCNRYMDK